MFLRGGVYHPESKQTYDFNGFAASPSHEPFVLQLLRWPCGACMRHYKNVYIKLTGPESIDRGPTLATVSASYRIEPRNPENRSKIGKK